LLKLVLKRGTLLEIWSNGIRSLSPWSLLMPIYFHLSKLYGNFSIVPTLGTIHFHAVSNIVPAWE
jgi:hypothetical protein